MAKLTQLDPMYPIAKQHSDHVTALDQSEGRISFKMDEFLFLHPINAFRPIRNAEGKMAAPIKTEN